MSSRAAPLHASTMPLQPPLRIYLAGPMTGLPGLNVPEFTRLAALLRQAGFDVVNPAEINAQHLGTDTAADWHACMRADIRELVTCQAIALMPGWAASKGASIERFVAHCVGLHITTVTELLSAPKHATT